MKATGRLAYANARVRALKSRLLGPEVLGRLRTGRDLSSRPAEGEDLLRFQHLLTCYRVVLVSYPAGQPLVRALFRLHEIENLKLAWRARVRAQPFERWGPLWRRFGALESIRLEECRDQTSLAGLVGSLGATPYAGIARTTLRAHAEDLLASELAFDRWASLSVVEAAMALPRSEVAARELAFAVVRERDLNLLRRGHHSFGLSPDAVVGSLAMLARELPPTELARFATWTPGSGRLVQASPPTWRRMAGNVTDWDGLILASRRARYQACRRAFLGSAYCLGPGIALLLLQEEEVRGVTAIKEADGRSDAAPVLERALSASALGA